ncbi:hypothetical protein [Pseudoalteromonas luteoviolacea]|uniref:Uncharacterized protein n=1 Tax=Pseudoalteromonas luteoviolacea S4054 TaxID=1129367 RepID=A0A0F6A861_9GAMM|nr:hypothetical protein [Pseudoalteromonas luteoviolacea]AOT07736.1 hypothetical protein S4054249_07720 [Pseudoalteromonas luteoviolacea]AOT12652.1 hypothetical protein S40542_07720 [Pseudoalteromonas luteoviolacea]AOT17565.1 hypothetical protein S4054_07715 [Pseudoalteromonas luteoviolacea]KKE81599.1 hypothetical protein N479_22135 [Pseudoalteromonas luteoviolacea S4054]KZN78865.1 hypothetical protein N481_00050 [Pseudoalteromonas luteoviolacea S4047-1]
MKFLFGLVLLASSLPALAAFNKCTGVYVGRIVINNQLGLDKVVLMESPESTSGSSWVNFAGWDKDAKKEALSVLMAAKVSRHRVDVATTAGDRCSIGTPNRTFYEVILSTNP